MPQLKFLITYFFTVLVLCGTQYALAITVCTPTTILNAVNAYRVNQGLQPLQNNNLIANLATRHSQDMASQKIPFGHDHFSERAHELLAQIPQSNSIAENVAYAEQDDAAEIMQAWLRSSGHKRNILGNFNLTGIGVAHGDGKVFVTEIFVRQPTHPN